MVAYSPIVCMNCTRGISMLWYGMNIPKSMKVKRRLDPLNFHFDSTYPFMLPKSEEIITAGIARITLLVKLLPITSNALLKLLKDGVRVGTHMLPVATSCVVLSEVTMAT